MSLISNISDVGSNEAGSDICDIGSSEIESDVTILDPALLDPISVISDPLELNPISLISDTTRLDPLLMILNSTTDPLSPASPAHHPRGVEDDTIRRAGRLRSLGARRLWATGQRGAASPSPRSQNVVHEASKTTRFVAPVGVLGRPKARPAARGPRRARRSHACRSAQTPPLASISSTTSSEIVGSGRATSATMCDGRGAREHRTMSSGGLGAGVRDPFSKATTRVFVRFCVFVTVGRGR